MIATFEDEPYTAPFSGNVIELCPVGALTSTQYRFEARPWEIQNVPTVCGLCPVGCNISATTREGQGQAHPLAQPPRGRRGLALRQGPLRLRAPARRRPDRRAAAQGRPAALRGDLAGTTRSTRPSGSCATAAPSTVTALSGSEIGRAGVRAREAAARRARRARRRAARGAVPDGSTRSARRSRRSATRKRRRRALRRAGRRARAGRRPLDQGRAPHRRARVTYGAPSRRGRRCRRRRRRRSSRARRRATHAFYLPRTPNGRGVADAWSAAADGEPEDAKPRAADHLRRRGRDRPERARARRADAEIVIGIGMFEESFRGLADLVLPGTSYLERDGTTVNLEGRLQRQRRAVIAPVPGRARVDREARRALRASSSRRYASVVFDEVSAHCYGGITFGEIGERAALPQRAEAPAATPARVDRHATQRSAAASGLRLVAYRPLFSGAGGRAHARAAVPAAGAARSSSSRGRRALARDRNGRRVTVSSNGTSRRAARADRARPRGRRRAHRRGPRRATSTPSWR